MKLVMYLNIQLQKRYRIDDRHKKLINYNSMCVLFKIKEDLIIFNNTKFIRK